MLNNITFGKYYDTKSRLHDMHIVIKIICLFVILIFTYIYRNYQSLLFILLFNILSMFMSNVPIKYYLKSIWIMKILILFIVIINLIFGGEIIVNVLQILIVVISSSIFMYTSRYKDIIYGLEIVFYPLKIFKINPKKIAFILSLTFRFIPDIFVLARQILKAQASRGIDYYNGNFKDKVFALKCMLIPLVIGSFRKASHFAITLELKSYNENSITREKKKLKFYDLYYLSLNVVVAILLFIKEVQL